MYRFLDQTMLHLPITVMKPNIFLDLASQVEMTSESVDNNQNESPHSFGGQYDRRW